MSKKQMIHIDGNFVPIEIEGADWVDKDDSLSLPGLPGSRPNP